MKILHLEDNRMDAELVRDSIQEEWPDCELVVTATQSGCLEALQREPYDLIISDYALVSFSGTDGLKLARQFQPEVPFIFFSGTIREETAIEAMRDGAADYVLKDRPQRLLTAIRIALQKRADRDRQRAAEARIRQQSELLDRARDAIIVTDGAARIVTWNQGAERLLGWTAEEAVGQPAATLLGPDAFTTPAGASSEEWRREVSTTTRTGAAVLLEVHVNLVRDDAGRPAGWISIGTDITEKNQLKEQFFRAQRLESLGMLASGIAHDLNNILAPIVMTPAILRPRISNAADLRLLDLLESSAMKGTELVRQIVAFAHGAAGQPQTMQVKHLLRDILAFIEHAFPRGIEVEHSIANDLWPVTGSPTQIHQVLLNLCINARDAMPDGGRLILRAENVVLDASAAPPTSNRTGEWILLQVQDTGTGMPPELLAKIWDPFFTTKAPGKGTGLGLSTVRGIVQAHAGFITVDTALGVGTTFQIYLPRDAAASAPVVANPP